MGKEGFMVTSSSVLRPPAETVYAEELVRLKEADKGPRPAGWAMSPKAVRKFLLGDNALKIERKFYGDDLLIERAIVDLLGEQGLMLVGEPGTAKSMLSELLAAAVSGRSNLTVQGSAGTTEDHIRYGWNYALLLAEGPSERALISSPVLEAMRTGRIVRIEEITRCPPEIQDTLISILSEKVIAIPELGEDRAIFAAPGFNVIATANLRDRGVHEMSSALKRRFNFETVMPIGDPALERALIMGQLGQRLARTQTRAEMPDDVIELLVTTFQDLRAGKTRDGAPVPRPDAVMSTAEAVNVAHAAAMDAVYFGEGQVSGAHVGRQLTGVVLKDNAEDVRKLGAYVDHVVKERARKSRAWKDMMTVLKAQKGAL
jgi:MoxR-like ATPase